MADVEKKVSIEIVLRGHKYRTGRLEQELWRPLDFFYFIFFTLPFSLVLPAYGTNAMHVYGTRLFFAFTRTRFNIALL